MGSPSHSLSPSRLGIALGVTKLTRKMIRRLGAGDGAALPGRILLLVEPRALRLLGVGVRSAVVSGTNGKTTTTALLRAALGGSSVCSNTEGANMDFGVALALAVHREMTTVPWHAPRLGAFEVDEAYLGRVGSEIRANVAVLLNLSRDQLDRNAEVRRLATSWRSQLATMPELSVVANVDDPMVVFAAESHARVTWVAGGANWKGDTGACPRCHAHLRHDESNWACTKCGLSRPAPTWWRDGRTVFHCGEQLGELALGIPGSFNLSNAVMALAGAAELAGWDDGPTLRAAMDRMSSLRAVGGRYGRYELRDGSVTTYLAKNPAGWLEMLELYRETASPATTPLVLGLQAEIADGRDPSWIWDVPFESVTSALPSPVIVTGTRALDLGVRLVVAGIEVQVEEDHHHAIRVALGLSTSGEVISIGNYTAFQAVRHYLSSEASAR
ncbi:MAG: MurT ligase domain-containing protein [Acidimicrobiales bacterium]